METGRKFVLPNAADNLLLLNLLTARETIFGDSGSNSSTMGPLLGYDGVTLCQGEYKSSPLSSDNLFGEALAANLPQSTKSISKPATLSGMASGIDLKWMNGRE